MRFLLISLILCLAGTDSRANEAASIEAEALEVAEQIQCLACSDPNIENAKDETAKDLRFFIRKHLTEGKSQEFVINLVLANYGDMVSLETAQGRETRNEDIFFYGVALSLFLSALLSIYRKSLAYKQET